MEFLSSANAEENSPQRHLKVDGSGDIEFAPLDGEIVGRWRMLVLRALLACSAARLQVTVCKLVEIEPRAVNDRTVA